MIDHLTRGDLQLLLDRFQDLTILVLGDFFLDRYLVLDPDLSETSLETGLEARQVVDIRNTPGAAGTVTSNLSAFGVGRIIALGAIGVDGQGFDLKAGLRRSRVDTDYLFEIPELFTPTYTKPILTESARELERIDIKNRSETSADLQARIIEALNELVGRVDAVMVMDQVQERNCGVVTDGVRTRLESMANANPDAVIFADSRTRIDEFRGVIIKANQDEATASTPPDHPTGGGNGALANRARALVKRNGRPVLITLGPDGILCADEQSVHRIPGIRVPDPVDIVGAGDSVSAAAVSALCVGASLPQAALLGVLASSITIQQIGTTGTASPRQILDRFAETYPDGWSVRQPD